MELLAELKALVQNASSIPLTSSLVMDRAEALAIIGDLEVGLPKELSDARHLLNQRDQFRHRVNRECEEIVSTARDTAERLVENTQVVKAARATARKIVEDAEAQALERQTQLDDWCDQKLASFEIQLQKIHAQVTTSRDKLRGNLMSELGPNHGHEHEDGYGQAQRVPGL